MQPTMQPALKFVDINPSCINALQQAFPDFPGVTYEICGVDQAAVGCRRPACIANAGNSFGMMDGGIDGHIAQLLSTPEHDMQREVQAAIALHHQGEQPVGTCLILTAHAAFDFLAYAPTMRVPLAVKETFNAYQAFRAVLLSVKASTHPIETVVCSAFCTGAGRMKPVVAAAQMRLAYDSVFHSPPQANWGHILDFHSRLEATTSLTEPKGRASAAAGILSGCCAQ